MKTAPLTSQQIMGKKKKGEPKATLYVEIPLSLKERFQRIADAHGRKQNAEIIYALEAYCKQHETEGAEDPEGE